LSDAPGDSFPAGGEEEESQVGKLISTSRITPARIAYVNLDFTIQENDLFI
jgi:hypothetical protein